MGFPDPCPDGPMRSNSVHLTCVTSLIISTQLHPMIKGKRWLLNSTELSIKDSVEDEKLRPRSYKHFLVWGILLHLALCIPHLSHQLLRVLPHIDLSWEVGIPARTLFLKLLHTSPALTCSHTVSLKVLHTSSIVFLGSPWERKVMNIPAHLYKHTVLFSILYSFSPCCLQFGTMRFIDFLCQVRT